jgi:plasmid stabilization system protein ParE
MALEIIWSPKALENFHAVIAYLEENWTIQVVRDFVKKTDTLISLIAEHSEMFREINKRNAVREAVVTKHNLLIYKVNKNQLILLAMFDTRQHPKKKKIS